LGWFLFKVDSKLAGFLALEAARGFSDTRCVVKREVIDPALDESFQGSCNQLAEAQFQASLNDVAVAEWAGGGHEAERVVVDELELGGRSADEELPVLGKVFVDTIQEEVWVVREVGVAWLSVVAYEGEEDGGGHLTAQCMQGTLDLGVVAVVLNGQSLYQSQMKNRNHWSTEEGGFP